MASQFVSGNNFDLCFFIALPVSAEGSSHCRKINAEHLGQLVWQPLTCSVSPLTLFFLSLSSRFSLLRISATSRLHCFAVCFKEEDISRLISTLHAYSATVLGPFFGDMIIFLNGGMTRKNAGHL